MSQVCKNNFDDETGQNENQDEPVASVGDEDLTDEHRQVLQESAEFYNDQLLSQKYEFEKVIKYLEKRGSGKETIVPETGDILCIYALFSDNIELI